jgi:hypothetical protein
MGRIGYMKMLSEEEEKKCKEELFDFIENDDWTLLYNYMLTIKMEREKARIRYR